MECLHLRTLTWRFRDCPVRYKLFVPVVPAVCRLRLCCTCLCGCGSLCCRECVFCEGIVFQEFGGDRRWIKRWISDLLAAAVTLVRWITTSHLWPHLPALCLTAEVCVWVCVCVCVGGCAGQLYSCDRMRLVDQWPNEHRISLGQWSERWCSHSGRAGVWSQRPSTESTSKTNTFTLC